MAEWNPKEQKWEVSDAELEAMLDEGDQRSAVRPPDPVVATARYLPVERRVWVELDNGTAFLFPVDRVQGLRGASDEQLTALEVWGSDMLAWPSLDAHVSVTSLMAGVLGSSRWMSELQRERGRKGGSARTATTGRDTL